MPVRVSRLDCFFLFKGNFSIPVPGSCPVTTDSIGREFTCENDNINISKILKHRLRGMTLYILCAVPY